MKLKIKLFSKRVISYMCLPALALTLLVNDTCLGYIIPSEQVIEYMTRNFSKFKTIVITQHVQQADESFFNEQLFMKSPDLVDRKAIGQDMNRTSHPDTAYYSLLMANNPSSTKQMLSMLKINLDTVEYSRTDGTIVYSIGDKGPVSPKILIEKERFLPLLLKYRSPDDPDGGIITIEFKDYRELDEGWFPFEIIYYIDNNIIETCSIRKLEANIPIDPSGLSAKKESGIPDTRARKETPSEIEADRLKQIIKSFEEKYD